MEAPTARLVLLLLLGAWAPGPGSASPEAPLLVNEDVKRTVDLSSHLAKVTAEVVLAHPGGGSTSRAASFLLALEPELEARLAHLGVQVKGEDEEENNLEVRETKIKGKSGRFFTVKLPVALDPGAKVLVIVETVYTHVLQPYPTQITQSEKQFVVFEGNHYFYSPYPTKTQTMRVKLASRNVESYTKLGNPTRSEDLLDYGPFRDIPAYSQTILPAAAQDVYYRDEIGNVSTSHLLILDDSVEMEIRPRFPLFGGWKTHYIVGYNLPSYEYLYNLGQFLVVRE
ncbi:dolichyl-diphosphooligosaccharide--protein glycosyltransferase subunit 1-like [Leptonychotes weddellii]|uniref:Dolichyl-diphosphooligosaccharide--protein glycosyltransferase subunit 1 n=1 Tax=Leptonychotes weddellii TaxID=9713 RepID=A0A7F8RKP0_LEPWE|nr:dolichyl-diphosphooligosaccharide--protein glycosyltransferase subunit 1-like [Leptonychotes weddellii]